MVQLKYVGTHQPSGMIVDVDEDRAKELLKTDEYEYITENKKVTVKEVKKDDSKFSKL